MSDTSFLVKLFLSSLLLRNRQLKNTRKYCVCERKFTSNYSQCRRKGEERGNHPLEEKKEEHDDHALFRIRCFDLAFLFSWTFSVLILIHVICFAFMPEHCFIWLTACFEATPPEHMYCCRQEIIGCKGKPSFTFPTSAWKSWEFDRHMFMSFQVALCVS